MPKQLTRGHTAKTVTVQVPLEEVHCRKLNQMLQDARDRARLRATFSPRGLTVQVMPHRDRLIRRLFSRNEIAMERLAVRGALAQASISVTPERLRRLGSPGRLAVLALQRVANTAQDCDVRAGQVRGAVSLLAGARKKRSFMDSPVKSRSAWLAQTGANSLVSGDVVRRVQLRRFCVDSVGAAGLPGLLTVAGDKPGSIVASLSIFRAAALSFIVEDMKGGKRSPQAMVTQIHKGADSRLLRLFIARWRRATVAGKIIRSAFPWFDAVDWLVGALHGARPASPGATRAPRSPRVVSPGVVGLRRAQTAAPSPKPPVRHLRSRVSTPLRHSAARRLPLVPVAVPQPGRQGVSLRMLNQLQSPTRLADRPAPVAAVRRTVSGVTAPSGPAFRPAANPASRLAARPVSIAAVGQPDRLAPVAILPDVLLHGHSVTRASRTSSSSAIDPIEHSRSGGPSADDSQ